MKKPLVITGVIVIILVIVAVLLWPQIKGILPVVLPPSDDIAALIDEANEAMDAARESEEDEGSDAIQVPAENLTEFPLSIPQGFRLEVLARDIPGARVMAADSRGNLWISQPAEDAVTMLTIEDGKVVSQDQVLRDLNKPHGLLFDYRDPTLLYIAEEERIIRVRTDTDASPQEIAVLPEGGRHTTRTLHWHPDGRLLVSIGSTCDVCYEDDPEHGAIIAMDKDGGNRTMFASGLRNAVFLATDPISGEVWVSEMGRDGLGDDLPPDEVNILQEGGDYGWPVCYGQNIHDSDFDKNVYLPADEAGIRNPCADKLPAHIDLQAHSAPLGLAFIPEDATGWPEQYWNDLLIAYHGSWNLPDPTGYKIVRFELDDRGNVVSSEDFVSGWLDADDRALGRPVDLLALPGGVLYISDDKAGIVYRMYYIGN